MTALPQGFSAHVAAIGIKDDTDDFVVLAADRTSPAAAVFTRSRFVGAERHPQPSPRGERPPAGRGRRLQERQRRHRRAGPAADAAELAAGVAAALGCPPEDVLVASTGVIGRPYPMDRVRKQLEALALPFARRPRPSPPPPPS